MLAVSPTRGGSRDAQLELHRRLVRVARPRDAGRRRQPVRSAGPPDLKPARGGWETGVSLGRILSAEQVAEALGLTVPTVCGMLRGGDLPGTMLRRRWYVRETDLEALFAAGRARPTTAREEAVRALVQARSRPRRLVVPPRPGDVSPKAGAGGAIL